MDLAEWTKLHVRHQDLLKKNISSLQEEKDRLIVLNKDTSKDVWLIQDKLDLSNTAVKAIVTYNTKKNLNTLIKEWPSIKTSDCKIFFANPQSNERWVVVPSHHAKVADDKKIKLGLESLAQNVSFLKD